ncbi:MAG TPA: DASH family cryptochrome [Oscillatoriales cyanobacterium M59_W2019_021]|nr:DASH family cryptochrome [Oscillatoriales cyanobacterium M4454_W2019_049]HIK52659.1 DASH family cryptochrome [Oscillatoriales cyanobacterium M59_W2019_021]
MSAPRILIWYRNDLRLHDREAIHQALSEQAQLIPLYCFEPRKFRQTSFGFPKTGAFRAQFLLESIADLRNSWRSRGSDLLIRRGKPERVIPELVKQLEIDAVYYQAEVTSEELAVENALQRALSPLGVRLKSFWELTLYHIDGLPCDLHYLPEIFTQFRKQVESHCSVRPPFPTPEQLPPLPEIDGGEIPTLADLNLSKPVFDDRAVLRFVGGETAALDRLNEYIWQRDCLKDYKQTRNGMLGADYSSKFSPWLGFGCLSPRLIYQQIQEYERERVKNDSTYWLFFELLWRDYFRFIGAKHGNRIFQKSGLQGLEIPWKEDWEQFQLWQTGQTGIPLIDANMRELAATGFMSNRGRQNVASFLTKNLGINWQMGAEWFESQLIDYDVCSNWGNWNYVAGIGNDARGFRYFNILKQGRDYDPEGNYIKHWCPELKNVPASKIGEPWTLSPAAQEDFGVKLGVDYPYPMVDLMESVKENEKIYRSAFDG